MTAVSGTVGGSSGGSGATGDGAASGFVTIADVSAYVVTANIAEADIADVTVGQAATVTFPAIADLTATATVTAVSPTASAENSIVSYATTITLDAVPEGVRLGQTAEVAIVIVSSAEDALYVPSAAITTASDGTSTVDVVDPETQETTTVTVETGVVGDEGTEITSGLSLGDTIVLGIATASDSSDDSGNRRTGSGGPQFGTGGGPGFVDGGGPASPIRAEQMSAAEATADSRDRAARHPAGLRQRRHRGRGAARHRPERRRAASTSRSWARRAPASRPS